MKDKIAGRRKQTLELQLPYCLLSWTLIHQREGKTTLIGNTML